MALQHLDELVLSDIPFADIKPFNVGPAEFVNLIANAEYILTDSFHGTIFSLLFKKQFFTFSRFESSSKASTNSRIESLLNLVGVTGRYIKATENIDECMQRNIDFELAHERINKIQKSSRQYLKESLEKANSYDRNN